MPSSPPHPKTPMPCKIFEPNEKMELCNTPKKKKTESQFHTPTGA